MFNKEEITAVLNILSRQGLKIDVTEAPAFTLLKRRFVEELTKLENPAKKEASDIVKSVVNDSVLNKKLNK